MTLKECYDKMGADYEGIIYCLGTEERIDKFLKKLLEDKTFDSLCEAFEKEDAETAFRAAHSMKGLCLNLRLKQLQGSTNMLTEELRGKTEISPGARILFEELKVLYQKAIDCISERELNL